MNVARSSTATATTATADCVTPFGGRSPIVGRFAPSPTGPLHEGSLLAAVGSYLQARAAGGRWLLRIEDVDSSRCRKDAETQILRTLEIYGFEWDGAVLRQSTRGAHYGAALATLQACDLLYRCSCSRRERALAGAQGALGCIANCVARQSEIETGRCSIRWQAQVRQAIEFEDLWQGSQRCEPQYLADSVLRRRDGLYAYQLAVVVDDAAQGVTQVVRGADLLDSTPVQILLQRALALPEPRYGHLPLLVEADGQKLAKSRRSAPLQLGAASATLLDTLQRLRQRPPAELSSAPVQEIWHWARKHWQPQTLAGLASVATTGPTTAGAGATE